MGFAKMLYRATVLIFGCIMLSSACKLSEHNILRVEKKLKEKMLKINIGKILRKNIVKKACFKEVSYKKHTGQSSTYNHDFPSRYGVDNDRSTMFCTNKERDPYWWVFFGKPYAIRRVEMWNTRLEGRRLREVEVTVGFSLKRRMVLCKRYKGPARNGQHLTLNCNRGIYGHYVKITLKAFEYLHLLEVKVFAEC